MGKYLAIATGTVVLLLLATTWWQGATIKGLRKDLVVAEQSIVTLQAAGTAKDKALADLHADLAARDAALAERDRQVASINQQRRAALQALKEATRNDQQTTAWADTPVPDAVRGLLQ